MSTPNGGSGSGQAPAGDPQTQGQAPQANNNGGSPSTASQAPQAGGDHTTNAANGQALSQAEYERMIADLRKEAAGHRTKLKQFEDAQAAAELATLSDIEKKDRQIAEYQQQLASLQVERQSYLLAREIARVAPSLNLIDPDAAALMLTASGELDYDGEGKPTNVAKLLEKLVQDKPYLVASNVRPPAPAPSSGGATNPGRGPAGGMGQQSQQSQPQRVDPKELYKSRKGLANPDLWKRQ